MKLTTATLSRLTVAYMRGDNLQRPRHDYNVTKASQWLYTSPFGLAYDLSPPRAAATELSNFALTMTAVTRTTVCSTKGNPQPNDGLQRRDC